MNLWTTTIIIEIKAGIQNGENIHHHDHVIYLASFNTKSIINVTKIILVSKENSLSSILYTLR